MTIEEFDNVDLFDQEVLYNGEIYYVYDRNSEEKLLKITKWDEECDEDDEYYIPTIKWVRYENCEIVNK